MSEGDAAILARLDRIADLLEQVLIAARPDARRSVVCAADREVLQVLRELLCAPPWKRDRYFKAREVLEIARPYPDLQARLAAALGPSPCQALGKLLARVDGQPVDGVVVGRHSTNQGTTVWRVSRVSGGDETHDTHQPHPMRG